MAKVGKVCPSCGCPEYYWKNTKLQDVCKPYRKRTFCYKINRRFLGEGLSDRFLIVCVKYKNQCR